MKTIDQLKELLKKYQLSFADEKELQTKIGHILTAHGIEFEEDDTHSILLTKESILLTVRLDPPALIGDGFEIPINAK